MMKEILSVITLLAILSKISFADQIHFKNNKTIQGTIVEETERYIKVDMGIDFPITYYRDEIDHIVYEKDASVLLPQDASPSEEQPKDLEKKENFLWQLESQTAKAYLFGSIHLGKRSMYPLAPPIEQAFNESDYLVVEINIEAIDPNLAQQTMQQRGMYLTGDRLENHISKETLLRLKDRLRTYGVPYEQFSYFKPWFTALTLTLLQIKHLGFEEEYGIDLYFLKKAKGEKQILELETLEEQLKFFDTIADQGTLLEYTLDSLEETEKMLDLLVVSWQTGDVATMERIMIEDLLKEDPGILPILQTLLFDRNIKMVEQIKGYLSSHQGTYFIVVGAGHLITDQGIVELLKKEGYTIKQL